MRLSNEIELGTGLAFTGSFRYCSNSIVWDYLWNQDVAIQMVGTTGTTTSNMSVLKADKLKFQ
jgi:hypothetical protein